MHLLSPQNHKPGLRGRDRWSLLAGSSAGEVFRLQHSRLLLALYPKQHFRPVMMYL